MANSITDTYKMKREILNFSKKFSAHLSSPEAKFTADMTYGIVASKSCLLTQISQRLQENTKSGTRWIGFRIIWRVGFLRKR